MRWKKRVATDFGNIGSSTDFILAEIANRVRARRLEKGLSRAGLSDLSGVPVSTITRFEQQHLISFRQFLDLAIALGYADQLNALLSEAQYSTIEELEQIKRNKNRKHGRNTTK